MYFDKDSLLLTSTSGLETIQIYPPLAMFIVGERFSLHLIYKLYLKGWPVIVHLWSNQTVGVFFKEKAAAVSAACLVSVWQTLLVSCRCSSNVLHQVASYLCLLPPLAEGEDTSHEKEFLLELLVKPGLMLPACLLKAQGGHGCTALKSSFRTFGEPQQCYNSKRHVKMGFKTI